MTSIFDQSVSSLEFLVIAIASIGNVALIVVMLKKKIVQRRPFETCLFSMAFSDLMFVLTTALPFSLYKLLGTWSLGVHICQVHLVGRAVFERISLLTIGFIGIESFRALGNVNGQAFSMGTTRAFIVCVWGFTLASGCPYAAWYVLTDNPDGSKTCHVIFSNSVTLAYTVVMRTLFVIPVVIVIICYTGVICRTVKSHRRVADMSSKASSRSTAERQRLENLLKVARSCIQITALYVVCKIPFTVVVLRASVSPETVDRMLAELLWLLSTANAATSPFAYGMLKMSKLKCCKSTGRPAPAVPVPAPSARQAPPDLDRRDSPINVTGTRGIDTLIHVRPDEAQPVTSIASDGRRTGPALQ